VAEGAAMALTVEMVVLLEGRGSRRAPERCPR
jgi:hypothetical protein